MSASISDTCEVLETSETTETTETDTQCEHDVNGAPFDDSPASDVSDVSDVVDSQSFDQKAPDNHPKSLDDRVAAVESQIVSLCRKLGYNRVLFDKLDSALYDLNGIYHIWLRHLGEQAPLHSEKFVESLQNIKWVRNNLLALNTYKISSTSQRS